MVGENVEKGQDWPFSLWEKDENIQKFMTYASETKQKAIHWLTELRRSKNLIACIKYSTFYTKNIHVYNYKSS